MAAASTGGVVAQDAAGWASDLDSLLISIRAIHPDPYRLNQQAAFDSAVAGVKDRLPSISQSMAALEIQRVLAMVGDGHTEWARVPEQLRGAYLPFTIRRFDEGWFIRTGDTSYAQLFGKPITRISGVPIHRLVRMVLPYVSGENVIGKLDDAGDLLRNVKVLKALGIAEDISADVSVSVLESDGTEKNIKVGVTADAWVGPSWRDMDALLDSKTAKPLYRRLDGNYACAWLPDQQLLYVMFNEVRDDGDQSIAEFFASVFEFADRVKPEKFVLDIRENSGGNLDLNGPIVRGIIAMSDLDRPGRCFVIIGPDTYSAAMNLAVTLERNANVLFVGSPTGATPNHFGDTRIVKMPNSGIEVEISELSWQNSDPRDMRPWITPDIPAHSSASMFLARRDPALEAIVQFQATDTLLEQFGPPMIRWQRGTQLQIEDWPSQLAPSAVPLEPVSEQVEWRIEECAGH